MSLHTLKVTITLPEVMDLVKAKKGEKQTTETKNLAAGEKKKQGEKKP